MNKLICSLIVAIGFGSLPVANAEESATSAPSVTAAHPSAHRQLTRKRHHHRRHHHKHHRHHHHSKSKGKK